MPFGDAFEERTRQRFGAELRRHLDAVDERRTEKEQHEGNGVGGVGAEQQDRAADRGTRDHRDLKDGR